MCMYTGREQTAVALLIISQQGGKSGNEPGIWTKIK